MMDAKDREIVPLPKEQWQGTPIPLSYTTREYYDVANPPEDKQPGVPADEKDGGENNAD